ncbi:hypothetical protein KSF78_0008764 [Schistosoma japonicum]|nr:hypothetical protein KSF78_0008764 [Schistosoma japonicum]
MMPTFCKSVHSNLNEFTSFQLCMVFKAQLSLNSNFTRTDFDDLNKQINNHISQKDPLHQVEYHYYLILLLKMMLIDKMLNPNNISKLSAYVKRVISRNLFEDKFNDVKCVHWIRSREAIISFEFDKSPSEK